MTRRIVIAGGGRAAVLLAAALAGVSGVVVTKGDFADERQAPIPPAVRFEPCTGDLHRHPYRGKRRRQWR